MSVIRRALFCLGLLMAASIIQAAEARQPVDVRAQALAAHVTVALPEGEGPFPVVVQMHGCGGRKRFQDAWAEVFRQAGFAAVVVDSFAPRGISTVHAYFTVCLGVSLRGDERAGDLFAALHWVRAQPWADAQRLAVAGWSHGGWTVLDALTLRPGPQAEQATGLSGLPEAPLAGVRGALLFYPYAGQLSRAARRPFMAHPATFAVLATGDSVVGFLGAKRALERLEAEGATVELHLFEGATHAFDEADARDLRTRFDPALTGEAQRLAVAFLRRRLAAP